MSYPTTREIPAGKILLAEYGSYDDSERSQVRYQETAAGSNGRTYTLKHVSPGFERAGSVARWTNGYWSVTFQMDNASHGRRFNSETDARDLFAKWSA